MQGPAAQRRRGTRCGCGQDTQRVVGRRATVQADFDDEPAVSHAQAMAEWRRAVEAYVGLTSSQPARGIEET